MQRTSGAGGCLQAVVAIILVSFALAIVIAVGTKSVVAAAIVAAGMTGVWVFIAIAVRRGREAKAKALLDEQQRQYAIYQFEQQRLAAAQYAEQQRLAAAQHAEQERKRAERWAYLVGKYGDANADRIWTGRPWVGCTVTMLLETLGSPAGLDEKVLKTKTKYTYKYKPTGLNRYALRVFVDDDAVIGWEDKDD